MSPDTMVKSSMEIFTLLDRKTGGGIVTLLQDAVVGWQLVGWFTSYGYLIIEETDMSVAVTTRDGPQ